MSDRRSYQVPPNMVPEAPPATIFTSKFRMGQRVQIDGAPDLVAVVIGFSWQHLAGPQLQLAWLHNGDAKEAWIAEWRVAPS